MLYTCTYCRTHSALISTELPNGFSTGRVVTHSGGALSARDVSMPSSLVRSFESARICSSFSSHQYTDVFRSRSHKHPTHHDRTQNSSKESKQAHAPAPHARTPHTHTHHSIYSKGHHFFAATPHENAKEKYFALTIFAQHMYTQQQQKRHSKNKRL